MGGAAFKRRHREAMERRRRQEGGSRRLAALYARRRRLLLITVICVWGGIWARAFQLQVLHHDDLAIAVDDQSGRLVTLTAPRGSTDEVESPRRTRP